MRRCWPLLMRRWQRYGRWLDERLSTSPLLVVVGFLGGALLGAVADWRLISRFLVRLDEDR